MCPVFEWLKQNGDHSKTGLKIDFSASLGCYFIKKIVVMTLSRIKQSRLAEPDQK